MSKAEVDDLSVLQSHTIVTVQELKKDESHAMRGFPFVASFCLLASTEHITQCFSDADYMAQNQLIKHL